MVLQKLGLVLLIYENHADYFQFFMLGLSILFFLFYRMPYCHIFICILPESGLKIPEYLVSIILDRIMYVFLNC